MRRPRSARTTSAASPRISLDQPGVLAVLGGERGRARAGHRRRRAAGRVPRPSRRPCGRRPARRPGAARAPGGGRGGGQQRRQVVAGADLGQAREGRGPQAAHAPAGSATSRVSTARVRGAAPGRAASARAQRLEVARRVDVERQRGGLGDATRGAGRGRAGGVAREGARAEGGATAPGGAISSALVPLPWRSGDDHDRGLRGRQREQGGHLGRVQRRGSRPARAARARRRARPRTPMPQLRGGRLAGLVRIGHDVRARSPRGLGRAPPPR